MTFRKNLEWAVIFTTLSIFTVYAVNTHLNGRPEDVYAKAIAASPSLSANIERFVITPPSGTDLANEIRTRVFSQLIQRFTNLLQQNKELCGITEEQFEQLAAVYDAEVKSIRVGDQIRSVVQITDPDFTKKDLQAITGAPDVHCILVEVYQNIILNLSAHLS